MDTDPPFDPGGGTNPNEGVSITPIEPGENLPLIVDSEGIADQQGDSHPENDFPAGHNN